MVVVCNLASPGEIGRSRNGCICANQKVCRMCATNPVLDGQIDDVNGSCALIRHNFLKTHEGPEYPLLAGRPWRAARV
jgi:hypothetical protein